MTPIVFGAPITDETLAAKSQYANKKITILDKASEALNTKNLGGKHMLALEHAEKLKAEYGNGVSTLCVFYNATGDTLWFVDSHDWEGHVWKSPYPAEVSNGQWGAFLHVHTAGTQRGSVAGVVYRGKKTDGGEADWVLSWSNPWGRSSNHKAYAEANRLRHYEGDTVWEMIKSELDKGDIRSEGEYIGGSVIEASISESTPVVFEAILTLKGIRPKRPEAELLTETWCSIITNVGDQTARVIYGTGIKEDVVVSTTNSPIGVARNWRISNLTDPLEISTSGSEKLKWMIYSDDEGRLCASVYGSRSDGEDFHDIGAIYILGSNAKFDLWICNNSIVIENEEGKFGREIDRKAVRFFLLTEEGILESNDPACMLNYMYEYSYY